MKLGTLTHDWLEEAFAKEGVLGPDWVLVTSEWDVTGYLPEGWTGTLDYLFQHNPTKNYLIADLKTIKPEAVQYLGDEPKKEHITQVSCYHGAVHQAVLGNVFHHIAVLYMPKGKDSRQQTIMPVIKTAPAHTNIFDRLNKIKSRVDEYVTEYERTGEILNKFLAPMPKPELKVYWNKATTVWDVKAYPHWTETYMMPFSNDVCPPTPTEKMGHWTLDGHWIPRKGHGTEEEIPMPSKQEMERRRG